MRRPRAAHQQDAAARSPDDLVGNTSGWSAAQPIGVGREAVNTIQAGVAADRGRVDTDGIEAPIDPFSTTSQSAQSIDADRRASSHAGCRSPDPSKSQAPGAQIRQRARGDSAFTKIASHLMDRRPRRRSAWRATARCSVTSRRAVSGQSIGVDNRRSRSMPNSRRRRSTIWRLRVASQAPYCTWLIARWY